MASLEIIKGAEPHKYDLARDRTSIGRHPDCNVILNVGAVSRFHAQILRQADQFLVEDLKSRNGTYVNGNRITEPTALADNDRLKICDVLFVFHADAAIKKQESGFPLTITEGKGDSSTILTTVVASSGMGVMVEVRPEAKLRAVLEITRSVGHVLQLEDLLPRILDSLFKIFPQADRGFVLLRDEANNRLIPKAIKNRRSTGDDSVRISRTIVRQAMEKGQAILCADASSDAQFSMSQSISDFRIRSIMCVPLMNQANKPLGILQLHTEDVRQQFTQEDLDLCSSVAGVATVAIENAQLHEDMINQEKIKRELQFARDVQRSFLPQEWPDIAGYGFYAYYEPASTVGGDYYDFIRLPDDKLAIVIGDVAGKGMPAALLMARLSSDVRFSASSITDPAQVVRRVNKNLSEAGIQEKFVTFLYLLLDTRQHTITVVNAGHLPPMMRLPGTTDVVEFGEEQAGLPLNVSADFAYESATTTLQPGTAVLLYTDGVSEAMNSSNECYDVPRIRETLRTGPTDAGGAGESVIKSVRTWAAGRSQSDDITLICFSRNV